MPDNIKKFKLDENIRLLYYKHRGNVVKISEESKIDIGYVEKVVSKLKTKQSKDVNFWVASSILQYIILGIEQRTQHLTQLLNEEMDKQPVLVSICCNGPVKKNMWDNEEHFVCLKCDKDCNTRLEDIRDHQKILKIVESLRAEQVELTNAMEKMGFSQKEVAPVNKITQFNVVTGAADLPEKTQKLIQRAEELNPREREKLRLDLNKEIHELEFEEGKQGGEEKK